jgi:predicted ArsR family transcriptional regulator
MTNLDILDMSKMLADEYSIKILAGSFKFPKSAQNLSDELNIPIAACYRRIHDLEECGLIECVGKVLTQEGRRVKIYRSQLKGAYISYEKGKLSLLMDMTKFQNPQFNATWNIL